MRWSTFSKEGRQKDGVVICAGSITVSEGGERGPQPTIRLVGATGSRAVTTLADIAADAGIQRVHVLAWRDLDDPEAGGSELHAHQILRRWAAAGLDVTM